MLIEDPRRFARWLVGMDVQIVDLDADIDAAFARYEREMGGCNHDPAALEMAGGVFECECSALVLPDEEV